MKAVPAWLSYSLLRVLMFAVPLGVLLALQLEWWLAALGYGVLLGLAFAL